LPIPGSVNVRNANSSPIFFIEVRVRGRLVGSTPVFMQF